MVVEDEYIVGANICEMLVEEGYQVAGLATSEAEAIRMALDKSPDLVLSDINLQKGGDGINAAKKILDSRKIPFIYLTAYSDPSIVDRASATDPYGYILKPFSKEDLRTAIETGLRRYRVEQNTLNLARRLEMALQASDLSVWEFNPMQGTMRVEGWLPKFLGQSGVSEPLEMDKEAFFSLFNTESADQLRRIVSKGDAGYSGRLKIMPAESESKRSGASTKGKVARDEVWVDLFVSGQSQDREPTRIGTLQDVTDQEERIQELRLSNQILANITVAVVVVDDDLKIRKANQAFYLTTGFDEKEVWGRKLSEFLTMQRAGDQLELLLNGNHQQLRHVLVERKRRDQFDALMTCSGLGDGSGQSQFKILILTDASESIQSEKKLEELAYTDQLTGLGNRNLLNNLIQELGMRSLSDRRGALIFLDLDEFKSVNDTLGHEAGDELLKTFGERLRMVMREEDHLIRMGGDEFVIFVTEIEERQTIEVVARKILASATTPFELNESCVAMSCSIGIAFLSQVGRNTTDLLKFADVAMYEAKHQGKNQFVFYDKRQTDRKIHYRIFIEQGVRQAVNDNRICPWWQPVVNASDGRLEKFEALCRWYDVENGVIPPSEFIAVAEQTDLIHLLGRQMLRDACVQAKLNQQAGWLDVGVSINVSQKQLFKPDIVEIFNETIEQVELDPSLITIEVSESALQATQTTSRLSELKKLGFKISIDDFGSGRFSLASIVDQSVDELKLDQCFVQGVLENEHQRKVIEGIIRIADSIGLTVVAEGVESFRQKQVLTAMGVHKLQGYLFARPIPTADLKGFVEQWDAYNRLLLWPH